MQMRSIVTPVCALFLVTLTAGHPGAAQLPQRPSLPGEQSLQDLAALRNLPSLKDLIGGAPLTSTLTDALTDIAFLDRFDPPAASPLLELPFGLDGGVTLVPGAWTSELQGFCLQAGTRGPTRGDGYAWAPLKGPKSDVISAILNGASRLEDGSQQDVQMLLWAVLARAKVSTLDDGPRRIAERLLSRSQLQSIDTSALDVLPSDLLDRLLGPAAEPVRRALEVENQMRDVLAEPGMAAYERLESIAVLPTDTTLPVPEGREVPSGRWSLLPNGAFVRYLPANYTELTLQLYVPEVFTIERDDANRITNISLPNGTSLAVTYAGDVIGKVLMTAAGSAARGAALHFIPRNAAAVTSVMAAAQKLIPAARRQQEQANDLVSLTQLALSIDDAEISDLLNRAWASALSDWAGAPAPLRSLSDVPQARVVTVGFTRPVVTLPRARGSLGGFGGGGFGGGSGLGATGGGRQRQGSTMKKPPKDDAMSRARKATDAGLGRVGSHVPHGGWGFRIPRELLRKGLDELYDAARAVADALEGDPPRQDFRQFTPPDIRPVAAVEPGADLSATDAANYTALVQDMTTMNAYMRAGIVAIDRHGGAVQKDDRAWASRQAQALVYLKRQAGLTALKVAVDLEKFGADAQVSAEQFRVFGQHFASLPDVAAPWANR